jgi:hypothetical protein
VMNHLTKRRVRDLAVDMLGIELPSISSTDLRQKLLEKHQGAVGNMFRARRAETVSIDGVKPSVIFDAYARKTGLFSDEAKKDQFPDAFIFEALRSVAPRADALTIVSDDKDFVAAIKECEHITRLNSIAGLFAALGLTIEEAPNVQDFVENNLDEIIATAQDELDQWGLQADDVDDAEIDNSTVEKVRFIEFRTFRTAGASKDILVIGRIEMDVKVSFHHPDWDSATYDSEDKVLIPHDTVEGEKNIDVEADFNRTLKVDRHGKPTSIAGLSFDDDRFVWVSISPNDFDYK